MLGFERYELLAEFWTIDRVVEDIETEERFSFLADPDEESQPDSVALRLAEGFDILTANERG